MANLTHSSTNWSADQEQTVINKKYTFGTEKKYVDKDIEFNINVPGINLSNTQNFYINDGLTTWYWEIDNNGNVLIT